MRYILLISEKHLTFSYADFKSIFIQNKYTPIPLPDEVSILWRALRVSQTDIS